MFEVIAYNIDFPDEECFPVFSGSEEECEDFFCCHRGYLIDGGITYQLEVLKIEEDD